MHNNTNLSSYCLAEPEMPEKAARNMLNDLFSVAELSTQLFSRSNKGKTQKQDRFSSGTMLANLAGGILSPVDVSQPLATSTAAGVLARCEADGSPFLAPFSSFLSQFSTMILSRQARDKT